MTFSLYQILFSASLLLTLLIPGIMAETMPSDLLVLTEEYAPYNYLEEGKLKGLSVDILESAFSHMNIPITRDEFRVESWDEAYQTALVRNNTILFSTGRIPEREEQFRWAGPIITDTKVLFGIAGEDTPAISGNITSYRIVAVTNDTGYQFARDAGVSPDKITTVSSARDAILMVENGTADLWSYGEMAGDEMINRYAADPEKFVPLLDLGSVDEYYAVQKDTDPAFVQALNTTLSDMKNNLSENGISEYKEIMNRYLRE